MRLRKRIAFVLAALLCIGIGAGIAYASIPGPDGVIHACYKNSNPAQGALIAIDSAASCPSGYTALNWNQTGPQGLQGTPGISGYEYVTQSFAGPFSPGPVDGTANCPAGKQVISSGFGTQPFRPLVQLDHVKNQSGQVIAARAVVDNSQGDLATLTVIAICAVVN